MSPKVANRFAGHMRDGDPRSQVFVAGGCTWPTVPAYRYAFLSGNATGIFSYLNTSFDMVEFNSELVPHWRGQWNTKPGLPSNMLILAFKEYNPGASHYKWTFEMHPPLCSGIIVFNVLVPIGPCNTDIQLGNRYCPLQKMLGETGSQFRMVQCEYNANSPPFDWPAP